MFYEAMKLLGTEKEETFLFEDAVYSVRTARKEGFGAVGVYDASMQYQQELIELTDHYIKDYRQLAPFWEFFDSLV